MSADLCRFCAVFPSNGVLPKPLPSCLPPPVGSPASRVLLQCGVDVDSRDTDGWTPLHAAAHWGQEEVCSLLADSMCDMGALNNVVRPRKPCLDTRSISESAACIQTDKASLMSL